MCIHGDRDFETCLTVTEDVDYVLHQAAWEVFLAVLNNLYYEEINIRGTLNMMEASVE